MGFFSATDHRKVTRDNNYWVAKPVGGSEFAHHRRHRVDRNRADRLRSDAVLVGERSDRRAFVCGRHSALSNGICRCGPKAISPIPIDAISRTNVKPERFRDHATFEIADSGVSFSVSVGVLAGTKWTISISIVRPNPGTHRTFIPIQVRSAAYCTFHIRRH